MKQFPYDHIIPIGANWYLLETEVPHEQMIIDYGYFDGETFSHMLTHPSEYTTPCLAIDEGILLYQSNCIPRYTKGHMTAIGNVLRKDGKLLFKENLYIDIFKTDKKIYEITFLKKKQNINKIIYVASIKKGSLTEKRIKDYMLK